MNKKILALSGIVAMVSMTVASFAGAALLSPPSYTTLFDATSTSFGTSLMGDLIPWVGFVIIVIFVGLIVVALKKYIVKALSKITGGRGRRGGRRRFR